MPRRTTSFDPRIMDSIPDPTPSPPEQIIASEEPPTQNDYDIATRLVIALGSLSKLEAWAALAYLANPGLGYTAVASYAQCSVATVRRAAAKLKASVAASGTPHQGHPSAPAPGRGAPPGVGSFNKKPKGPRTRRGAKGKQTNAKG